MTTRSGRSITQQPYLYSQLPVCTCIASARHLIEGLRRLSGAFPVTSICQNSTLALIPDDIINTQRMVTLRQETLLPEINHSLCSRQPGECYTVGGPYLTRKYDLKKLRIVSFIAGIFTQTFIRFFLPVASCRPQLGTLTMTTESSINTCA